MLATQYGLDSLMGVVRIADFGEDVFSWGGNGLSFSMCCLASTPECSFGVDVDTLFMFWGVDLCRSHL